MSLCRSNILKYILKRGLKTSTAKIPDLTKVRSEHFETFHTFLNFTKFFGFKDRYPVHRGKFSDLNDKDVAQFESILGKSRVLIGDEAAGYNIDWMRSVRGFSNVVLKPKSTGEVSEIMKYCNSRTLAVCPQGGNTGLVS